MLDVCHSLGDIHHAMGNIALILAFLSIMLGAITELRYPAVRKHRVKRLVLHGICALLLAVPAAYLWLQVYAINYAPGFSRWLDALLVGAVCS